MAQFLDEAAFAAMFGRSLTSAESAVANPMLEVVDRWIRDNKPGITDDDPAAKVVSFEVTRDALICGEFGPMTSFTKTMGPRTRAATIDRDAVSRFVTSRHRQMLGLSGTSASPQAIFVRFDY